MPQLGTAILIDSRDEAWKLGPGWVEHPDDQFVGKSSGWGRFNDSTSIALEFTGIGISCIGNGVPEIPWSFTSSIDQNAPTIHSIEQEAGILQLTHDWYTSPALSEGKHTLQLSRITRDIALDYALIKPSPSQNIKGETLVVDDRDPSVRFIGGWRDVNNRYFRHEQRPVVPYGGGTHISDKVGDVFQFAFTGSVFHVYGFYDWTLPGTFNLSFSLDNFAAEENMYENSAPGQAPYLVQPNFIFYGKSLPPGDHILTVNITHIAGRQQVIIDAIHYVSAFETMDSMPRLTIPEPSVRSGSAPPRGVVVATSTTPPEASFPTGSSSSAASSNRTTTGTIIGAIVGAPIGVAVIAFLVLWHWRRRHALFNTPRTHKESTIEPFTSLAAPPVYPVSNSTYSSWFDTKRAARTERKTNSLSESKPISSGSASGDWDGQPGKAVL